MSERPTLLFDGDSRFCAFWVGFWRSLTSEKIDYVPLREAVGRFPELAADDSGPGTLQFVTAEGRVTDAAAVFNLLRRVPGYGWLLWLYNNVPPFAAFARFVYGLASANSGAAYRASRMLWGEAPARPTYFTASSLFAVCLSLIYLIAFASFGMQARGLVGSDGILPFSNFLDEVRIQVGSAGYWHVPTIFWWARSDFALLSIAWGGVALAAISILAKPHSSWRRIIYTILFVYYLSLVWAGQIFMGYQWDYLLLETGFLAIFLRPSRPRIWLFQWLLFRLTFESGAVKLLSHDVSWHNLTALAVHYQTQPLPTPLAWYAMQLPLWFQQVSTLAVFAIELVLPFFVFGPRRMKQVFACGTIFLQVLIFLTGNYTFFNLLTISLCLLLFDDRFFAGLRLASWFPPPGDMPVRSNRYVSGSLYALILFCSLTGLAEMFVPVPSAFTAVVEAQSPFGIVNRYGLFAVMTTVREEIEIEGSLDGEHWKPYVFRSKAGPLDRRPPWVAPFQPRLDWQMWFAALGHARDNPWFARFMARLLRVSKPVMALLEQDPFDGVPPMRIRANVYEYRFTSFEERSKSGHWWKRELKGVYFPAVGLRPPGER